MVSYNFFIFFNFLVNGITKQSKAAAFGPTFRGEMPEKLPFSVWNYSSKEKQTEKFYHIFIDFELFWPVSTKILDIPVAGMLFSPLPFLFVWTTSLPLISITCSYSSRSLL